MLILPVPLGDSVRLVFEAVVLIVLPLICMSSTKRSSIFLLASTSIALLAVNVPGAWSSWSVKYFPPMTNRLFPSPMYNLAPPWTAPGSANEYASSPALSDAGAPAVILRLILIVDAI